MHPTCPTAPPLWLSDTRDRHLTRTTQSPSERQAWLARELVARPGGDRCSMSLQATASLEHDM